MVEYSLITALDVVRDRLKAGAKICLRVSSESMAPYLQQGDYIFTQAVMPADLMAGDLVVVDRGTDLVTHRFLRSSGFEWSIKADTVACPDPPITSEQILGRVYAIQWRGPQVDISTGFQRALNRWIGRWSVLEAGLYCRWDNSQAYLSPGPQRGVRRLALRLFRVPYALLKLVRR
jgi:hypothetical protein